MSSIREAVGAVLACNLPARAAQSVAATLPKLADQPVGSLDTLAFRELLAQIQVGLKLFGCKNTVDVLRELRTAVTGGRLPAPTRDRVAVKSDGDVLTVQRRCQALVRNVFNSTDCIRLTTAVSELARNIYMYAKEGELELEIAEDAAGVRFTVLAVDHGPGIPNLSTVLSGAYVSRTGLGRGLLGARALLDDLQIETAPGRGTSVRGVKRGVRA